MKSFMAMLRSHFKMQSEGFFCLLGLVGGGLALYFGLEREIIRWKLVIMGGTLLSTSLLFLSMILKDFYSWLKAFWRDMTPRTISLKLPAPLLLKRLEQLKSVILESAARETITIKVNERQAQWIYDSCLDIHLNKQSWCASVSLVGGGILFPIECYRITQKAPLKLPQRFLTSELTSCILCWDKNQLYIFPNTISDETLKELMLGLLAPNETTFLSWLQEYKERLAEDFSEEE